MGNVDQYVKEVFEKQKLIFSKTEMNIKAAQEKQKQQYAKRKELCNIDLRLETKLLDTVHNKRSRKEKNGRQMVWSLYHCRNLENIILSKKTFLEKF